MRFELCAAAAPAALLLAPDTTLAANGSASAVAVPGAVGGSRRLCVEGDATAWGSAASFDVAAAPAASARAVLRTATVYQSRPALRVAYQLFDADGNTRVAAPSSVVLTLAFAGGSEQQVTCGARGGTNGIGLCAANVDDGKFSSSEARTATLFSLVVDGVVMLNRFGDVTLAKTPASTWNPTTNFVIGGQLPKHPVFAGDTFDLQLLAKSEKPSATAALTTYQVDVWSIRVTWSPADALSIVGVAPSGSWTSSFTTPAAPTAADGTGGLALIVNKIADTADPNIYGAQMDLGKISFRANTAGATASLVLTKVDMVAYSNGIALGEMGIEGPLLDARDGIGNAAGEVAIVGTAPSGLFLYPTGGAAAMANYAAATGNAATLALRVVEVYDKPSSSNADVTGAASCAIKGGLSAVDDAAASLFAAGSCTLIAGNGGASGEDHDVSGDVTVEASLNGNQVETTVGVYRPDDVEIRVEDTTLTARIVYDASSCGGDAAAVLYQSTRVRVVAVYDIAGIDTEVDITGMTGVTIVSSDPSVLSVDSASGIAVGVSPGTATLSLATGGGSGTVTVSSDVVSPRSIIARVVTAASLRLGPEGGAGVPPFSDPFAVAVAAEQTLTAEGDEGAVYAWAEYANGDIHALAADEVGVYPQTDGVDVLPLVAGRHRVAVAAGAVAQCHGELLRVSMVDGCGAPALNGTAPLTLALPQPTSATLAIDAAHLAPLGDLAADSALDGAYKSTAKFTATVEFEDGSTKDLSTDGRVALALADGSGACADVVATLGDADLEGGGQLRMKTFGDHIDAACDSVTVEATVTLGGGTYVLRASATVGIARFESFALSAQLYPAPIDPAEGISFDGGARPLKLVHCSGKYERARLSATATVSRSGAADVTKAVDLRLVTLSEDSGGATLKSAILNVPGPSGGGDKLVDVAASPPSASQM